MPERIQRKRTKGWKMPPNTVYVGRPSLFGNLYTGPDAVARFEATLLGPSAPQILGFTPTRVKAELRGKNQACWCPLCEKHKNGKPLDVHCPDCAPCHVDPLGRIANA